MANTDSTSDGAHYIRLSNRPANKLLPTSSIAALRDYLEQCDNRCIAPNTHLFLSAEDRLTRDNIVTALPLCINIIRIGTTLVLPNGEKFGQGDINTSLSLRLVLALATLIGIGGRLTAPPLPHHRAYGSRTTAVRSG